MKLWSDVGLPEVTSVQPSLLLRGYKRVLISLYRQYDLKMAFELKQSFPEKQNRSEQHI